MGSGSGLAGGGVEAGGWVGSAVASGAVLGVGVADGSAVGVGDGSEVADADGDGVAGSLATTGIEAGPRAGQPRAGAVAPGGAVPRLPAPSGLAAGGGVPVASCQPTQTASGSPSTTIAAKTTFGVLYTPFHRTTDEKVAGFEDAFSCGRAYETRRIRTRRFALPLLSTFTTCTLPI